MRMHFAAPPGHLDKRLRLCLRSLRTVGKGKLLQTLHRADNKKIGLCQVCLFLAFRAILRIHNLS